MEDAQPVCAPFDFVADLTDLFQVAIRVREVNHATEAKLLKAVSRRSIKHSHQLLSENRLLGVGEFFVAAVVAAIVDEFLGGGEIGLQGSGFLCQLRRSGIFVEQSALS